jgi:hypothetical protein
MIAKDYFTKWPETYTIPNKGYNSGRSSGYQILLLWSTAGAT